MRTSHPGPLSSSLLCLFRLCHLQAAQLASGRHLPSARPASGADGCFAAREVIGRALWSLIIIGATLVIGRFFCGYVCPMGVSIDFLDFLFFRKKKRPGLKNEAGLSKIKILLAHHFS